jgi:lysozyme family protein
MDRQTLIKTGIAGAIFSALLAVEGGYSNDPSDPGGETKYGITARVAREAGYTGEMKDLTKEQAQEIYTDLYIMAPGFNRMIDYSPALAHKLIDAGVNVGTARAAIWFQQALNAYSNKGRNYPRVSEDGVLGNRSIEAYRSLQRIRGKEKACTLVLKAIDGYQATYYLSLTSLQQFTAGWMDKRVGNIPLDQCREYTLLLPLKVTYEDSGK